VAGGSSVSRLDDPQTGNGSTALSDLSSAWIMDRFVACVSLACPSELAFALPTSQHVTFASCWSCNGWTVGLTAHGHQARRGIETCSARCQMAMGTHIYAVDTRGRYSLRVGITARVDN
jgi:hypothetical protein